MLGHRLRRWPNIKPVQGERSCLSFQGAFNYVKDDSSGPDYPCSLLADEMTVVYNVVYNVTPAVILLVFNF